MQGRVAGEVARVEEAAVVERGQPADERGALGDGGQGGEGLAVVFGGERGGACGVDVFYHAHVAVDEGECEGGHALWIKGGER